MERCRVSDETTAHNEAEAQREEKANLGGIEMSYEFKSIVGENLEVTVCFDHEPYEPPSLAYPGCDARVLITAVTEKSNGLNSHDLMEDLNYSCLERLKYECFEHLDSISEEKSK